MNPETDRLVWIISPHASRDYDEAWLPAETEKDNEVALDYASDRLAELWDQYEEGAGKITVTMERRLVPADELEALEP